MAASTGRQFTNPPSAKLADPTAEKVRANLATCIRELQKKVNELSGAVESLEGAEAPDTAEPEWELVERKTLTSAATSVTFAGLNGNTDVEYKLRGYIVDDSASNDWLWLYPNGSTSNASGQFLVGVGATVAAGSQPGMLAGRMRSDAAAVTFEGVLWAKAGSVRTYQGSATSHDTSTPAIRTEIMSGHWTDTSTKIASIVLSGPTGAFGAGTQISLYRRAS